MNKVANAREEDRHGLICGVSVGSIPVDLHISLQTGDSGPRGKGQDSLGEAAKAKCDGRRARRGRLMIIG